MLFVDVCGSRDSGSTWRGAKADTVYQNARRTSKTLECFWRAVWEGEWAPKQ